jgi:hypothetical protein
MQIETIAVNVRSRSPWEAIDLGFAMVRAWWLIIYTPLAILSLGMIVALLLFIPYEYYWVSLVALWWLKPLYHRLILHIISHQMFGDTLTWGQALRDLPRLMRTTGLFSELTWRRFSFSRGFNLPVWQLERLRGSPRSKRQKLLLGNVHSQAIWLTVAIFFFQLILTFSFFMLLWLFVPDYYADDLLLNLFTNDLAGVSFSFEILAVTGFVVVMVFLEPYYVAASFALYLNRRTQLEAWDIELEFKKMAQRLEALKAKAAPLASALLVLALALAGTPEQVAYADETAAEVVSYEETLFETRQPASESAQVVKQVMTNENLVREKLVKRWRSLSTEEEEVNSSDSPAWLTTLAVILAKIIEFSLWLLIFAVILALYYYREYWIPVITRQPKSSPPPAPEVLFGMDVRSDSLPDDLISAARQLWESGKARDALSLLYRGALVHLINQEQLELKHSHTEGDILSLSQLQLSETKQDFFGQLTRHWVRIAYAHQPPQDADMLYLLDHWTTDFADNMQTQVVQP